MKIRRYTCSDMQEAMLKVKMELGSEAVIMSSRKVKKKGLFGLFSKPMIEVVAAIDDDFSKPSRPAAPVRQSPSGLDGLPPIYREPQREAAQPPMQQPYSQTPVGYQHVQASYQAQMNPYQQHYAQQSHPGVHQPQQAQTMPQTQSQAAAPIQAPGQGVVNNQQPQSPIAQQLPDEPLTPVLDGKPEDNEKIVELESKVKNMESMLEQIYKAVNDKKDTMPSVDLSSASAAPVAATDEKDNLSLLRTALYDQELDSRLIEKVLEKVREKGGNSLKSEEMFAIASRVMQVLLGEPDTIHVRTDGRPQVVVFIGPTGVGKTTTLAKIAADFTLNKQKKVGLITADTYRIAAVEQLKTYAEILNIPVTVVYSPNEIKDAIGKLSDKDLILIDTAGRSHKNKSHFDELKTLVNSISADETYLVMSANTSRAAAREILEYYSFIKSYKLLFTKLDETPVPGIIINSRYITGKPLSYTTAGQSVPDDLDVANPKVIVSSFMGQKRTAE